MRTITLNKYYGITADGVQINDNIFIDVVIDNNDSEGNILSTEHYFGKADTITFSCIPESFIASFGSQVVYIYQAGDRTSDNTELMSPAECFDYFRLAIAIYE